MTEKELKTSYIFNEEMPKDDKDIFDKFSNYFNLNPKNINIKNPYNYNTSIEFLKNLSLEKFTNNINEIVHKEFDLDSLSNKNDINFSINNVLFLTSKISSTDKIEYILLNDLKNDNYIARPTFESNADEILDTGMNIRITTKDDGKKEISIKCIVEYEAFTSNIIHNLINKSSYGRSKEIYKNSLDYKNKELANKNLEFDIKIFANSINKIIYTDKGEYIFDLQFPPKFRTNFLIDTNKLPPNAKKSKNNYTYYENIMFPFRNFQDEIANLKYRHFYILIQKDKYIKNNNEKDSIEQMQNALGNIFFKNNYSIESKKFQNISDINIVNENKIKANYYKKGKYELSDYFRYNSDENIYKILKELKFIKDENDYINYDGYENEEIDDYIFDSNENENEEEEEDYYYMNKDKDKEIKNKKPEDEEVIKLFYQIIALISEGILSYYNAIEFVENILFKKSKNYLEVIFSQCQNIKDYPTFFNLTLTKILEKYQNSLEEQSLSSFEYELQTTFNGLYTEYLIKGFKEILKPSKNPILTHVQRCVVTPTYILFTPYILDQGNRILRDFLTSTNLSMLCVFKMDNFEEGKWNNKFLIEYIKYVMYEGFLLGEKKFKFFNFSQSQFRNMSCWLLTNPNEILEKTGDYSNIKIVSKFGARVSQTLTTTIKTINIPDDHIIYIDDVLLKTKIKDDKGNERDVEYTFSDGVGKISYKLAEQISKIIHLNNVPACFQGRFLGCKGVWTTIYDDYSGNIYIRPSQEKFKIKRKVNNSNYFELCDYSRYIQAYLNRQVILLMKANGIPDGHFMKKLKEYRQRLEDEKFVLSLVHYNEWNNLFQYMSFCDINKTNDRLMKSLIESNLYILYNDIKNKARIYVEDSAYVIGIMDEFNILEYGQAFLHIKRKNLDLILNKKCTIAKCPCLHPGDVRVLDFKSYVEGDKNTEKYKIFEKYENVLIFPSKGKRPHPNECSGSDLDGDNYFVFYDEDLIIEDKYLSNPMNYSFSLKSKNKDNIQIKDVIEYFAEYTNLNNLGLIGDAHLALSDKDPKHAKGEIPMRIAQKFSRAVDAPKTGDDVTLDEDENPKKFPHYMCKAPSKTYISNFILGKLYDEINNIIDSVTKKKEINKFFYDINLKNEKWENFALLAMIFYRDFYEEIISLMKKNDIKGESVLLTGNNIDNDESVFSKRKNNYDLREKISDEMRRLFKIAKNNFDQGIKYFFTLKNFEFPILKGLNEEIFFKNNLNIFASACYMVSYDFYELLSEKNLIDNYGNKFKELIFENNCKDIELEDLNYIAEGESEAFGVDFNKCEDYAIDMYYDKLKKKNDIINDIIEKNMNDMKCFINDAKRFNIPKNANEENQYRILSFPWCVAGTLLSKIKFLS